MPCNGGLKVAVCRKWWQLQIAGGRVMVGSRWQWVADGGAVFGEGNCRLWDAVCRRAQGGAARSRVMVGNGLQMVAPCYWGMQLQNRKVIKNKIIGK